MTIEKPKGLEKLIEQANAWLAQGDRGWWTHAELIAGFAAFVSSKAAEAPRGPDLGTLWTQFLWQDTQGNKSASKCTEAVARRFAEFVLSATAAPSERADEREKFKNWAKDKPWYRAGTWAYGEKEGQFADEGTQEFWGVWQARAGLSSQEGRVFDGDTVNKLKVRDAEMDQGKSVTVRMNRKSPATRDRDVK